MVGKGFEKTVSGNPLKRENLLFLFPFQCVVPILLFLLISCHYVIKEDKTIPAGRTEKKTQADKPKDIKTVTQFLQKVRSMINKQSDEVTFFREIAFLCQFNTKVQPDQSSSITDFYFFLKSLTLTYELDTPVPGDLIFFHNTRDQNRDNKNNDWYSYVGVVEEVIINQCIIFIGPGSTGRVTRHALPLFLSSVDKDTIDTRCLQSSPLKNPSPFDPPFTKYRPEELFAGFAQIKNCLNHNSLN